MAKLPASRASGYLKRPDPAHRAILLYGPDPTLTADRREALVRVLLGADDDPFRLARLAADAVRRDPATLTDECNAISFGGGDKVVVLTDATESVAPAIAGALDAMIGGAVLVVTADSLSAGSKLRKLFEGHDAAIALPFYPAEGSALADEVAATVVALGAPLLDTDARRGLTAALDGVQHGEAMRFAEVLALHSGGDPLTEEAIALCAPPAAEADFEAGIQAVTQGRARDLPGLFDRFEAQGASLPGLIRVLSLYMARLHRAQAMMEDGGLDAQAAMNKLRPPVFWKIRDAFAAQLRAWPRAAVESALSQLSALESELRSGKPLPDRALIERTTMRIAMSAPGAGRRG